MRQKNRGFSLVELLVVIAIISILMAMYMSVGSRALSRAKQLAASEGMRQEHLGHVADNANIAYQQQEISPDRAACRAAYRQTRDTGREEIIYTELLYEVPDESYFKAYWHTLINPSATAPLEFTADGRLIAKDEHDNKFVMRPLDNRLNARTPIPVTWEYLSRDPKDTSHGLLGINVLYSDGHVMYMRYPSYYPAVRSVADLSWEFLHSTP
ncbi:MAG: type II secretion system GspH family protein [Candidatus Hydrogenedentes bacterium]|nr:type II secretion system GspH family protein [Candidatus Hydrogenedentota bacterium]